MITLKIEATNKNLDTAIKFIAKQLQKLDCTPEKCLEITVCVEELFINIAQYAYKDNIGYVEIQFEHTDDVVSIRLIDDGLEFNPLKNADPDVTIPISKQKVGGLGIYMVKRSMDSIDYKRVDNKNILTICKKN